MSDIATTLSCDPSGLTAGMTEARAQINQTTEVIHTQDTTWRSFTSSVLDSVSRIVAPIIRLVTVYKQMQLATITLTIAQTAAIPPTITLAGAMSVLLSPVVLTAAAIAVVVGALWYFTSASDETSKSVEKAAASATESIAPVTAYGKAWAAIKGAVFTDEAVHQLGNVQTETTKLTEQLGELKTSLMEPFEDAQASLTGYIASFIPLESGATLATTAMKYLNSGVKLLSKSVEESKATWLAWIYVVGTGASQAEAEQFVKQGRDIKNAAEATQKMTDKLTEQQAKYKELRAIQEGATAAVANSAEVAKISSIMTLEGIEEKTAALRASATAAVAAGKADEAWKEQTKSLFDALAKQRQGIIDGTVVDKKAEEAKRALAKATEDAAKAAARAAEQEIQHQLQGTSKIESLKDQVDLLSGAATSADIAMREMWRGGFSEDQIEEVGKLTAELDRLKEEATLEKKDKAKKNVKEDSKAVFEGSSAAAEIMLRGIGGGQKMETLAQKQIAATKDVVTAVREIEMPYLMAGDFGTGGTVA